MAPIDAASSYVLASQDDVLPVDVTPYLDETPPDPIVSYIRARAISAFMIGLVVFWLSIVWLVGCWLS